MGRRSMPRAGSEIACGRPVVLTTGAEPDAEGRLVVAAECATTVSAEQPTEMARTAGLRAFARRYGLAVVTVPELVSYWRVRETPVRSVAITELRDVRSVVHEHEGVGACA